MTNIPMTDFMIDFMYILAPPSPLNKVHLKVRDLYFVKYICFLKLCTYVLNMTDCKQKRKKNQTNIWLYFLQKRWKQKHCNSNWGCLAALLAGQYT